MKQLKFEHSFAAEIVSGNKTATFRVNDDKDIRIGDEVELVDKIDHDQPMTWEIPGVLKISAVDQVPLTELSDAQYLNAESFSSKQQMIEAFRRFYGDHISEDTLVTVLHFTYERYEAPRKFLDQTNSTEQLSVRTAKLYADGGSRGNPGPSAYGFVILSQQNEVLHAGNKYLGITTNNQAEYHGVLSGMKWALEAGIQELDVYLDSLLVVNQLSGKFKVKNRDLWSLYETTKGLRDKFKKCRISHVPRELNKLADAEVNKALDAVKGTDIAQ